MICVRGWECGGINLTMMIFMAFPTNIFNWIRAFSSIFPTRCRAGAFIFIRGTQIFYWFDAQCFLTPRKLQRSLKNEQSSVNETEWLIVHVLLFPWIRIWLWVGERCFGAAFARRRQQAAPTWTFDDLLLMYRRREKKSWKLFREKVLVRLPNVLSENISNAGHNGRHNEKWRTNVSRMTKGKCVEEEKTLTMKNKPAIFIQTELENKYNYWQRVIDCDCITNIN